MDVEIFRGLRGRALTEHIAEVGVETTVEAVAVAMGDRLDASQLSPAGVTVESSAITEDGMVTRRVHCSSGGVRVLGPDDPLSAGDADITFVGQRIEDGVLLALGEVRLEALCLLARGTLDGRAEAMFELARATVLLPEDAGSLTLLPLLELWPLTRRDLDEVVTDEMLAQLHAAQQEVVADMIGLTDVAADLDGSRIEFRVNGPSEVHRSHLVVADGDCRVDPEASGPAHLRLTWKRGAEYVQWLLGKIRAADAAVTGMIAIDGDVGLLTPLLRLPEPAAMLDTLPEGLRPDLLGG